MRVSEAGLTLIRRSGADGAPEYLVQWNDKWQRFALVGGHREPGESFRACCVREVAEELELAEGAEYRVAPEPVAPPIEYRARSGSAGVETLYRVELYLVELLTHAAAARVAADPANRWLTEPEIRRRVTHGDGKDVSAQVETVLILAGVLT
jgi:8-oxo-dGTP pyrophosphatase MutT (NUDIX family)